VYYTPFSVIILGDSHREKIFAFQVVSKIPPSPNFAKLATISAVLLVDLQQATQT